MYRLNLQNPKKYFKIFSQKRRIFKNNVVLYYSGVSVNKFFLFPMCFFSQNKNYILRGEAFRNTSREVEKGTLSQRIGRKVMGLRYCHYGNTTAARLPTF